MKIYIVRHGETDSNKLGKLMGQRVDESLNAEGIVQADKLAQDVVSEGFEILFISPLKRALQTAQIVSDKIKIPIIIRQELLERDFCTLSGKPWDEMSKGAPGNIDWRSKDFEQKYDYRPFGGESVEDVKKRLLAFIEEIKRSYSNKKILVIAHGGILKLAHLLFKYKHLESTPENASIHEFDI